MKYFVCWRIRRGIDLEYAAEFVEEYRPIMHSTYEEAHEELRAGFYDDSDYTVMSIDEQGTIDFARNSRRR